jgi:hypothetical protein
VRKRAAALLERLAAPSAAELRDRRAIQALERMATPEAEALLKRLASGGRGHKTAAALAALRRLGARR